MRRKEALIAVIGGVVGAVLTMAVCSVMPIGAQSQSDAVFGKITCRELEVVARGRTMAQIKTLSGHGAMTLYTQDEHPYVQMFNVGLAGGTIALTSADHGKGVFLGTESVYAHKRDPIFDLQDEGWGELVLSHGKNRKKDVILPMALVETNWGACDCN